ncbi:MAG: depupylase/deamidase Dop [Actinomycetota bacterium]
MAIPKILGIETEYGITVTGVEDWNPVTASSAVVTSYAGELRRIRWDFEDEHPLRDARGFETAVLLDAPTDEDLGLASVVLTNGARFYVDHAHPEYSTPECTDPYDLVVHDRAGERIMESAIEMAGARFPDGRRFLVYKNNTDNKGVSYGCHENYLVSRQIPFPAIVELMIPHFVTRQVYLGAGLLTDRDEEQPYRISQRADFFEVEVGLETTLKRPIVNTRDEPHADPEKYRRLHVIIGDANMSEVATWLKTGVTALILSMLEDDQAPEDLHIDKPVATLRRISRDITCAEQIRLKDGRSMTPVQVQWLLHESVSKWATRADLPDWGPDILRRWEEALAGLERDPMSMSRTIDWVAKYKVLQEYREKHSLDARHAKLHMLDLQYHDVRRSKGISYVLERSGKLERLTDDASVDRAMTEPPNDTRAYFRGKVLERFGDRVAAASWDSIIFDLGGDRLQRLPMHEPLKGTEEMVGEILEQAEDAEALVAALRGAPGDVPPRS